MRILCIVSDTERDATNEQRRTVLAGLAAHGHDVREVVPPLKLISLWQDLRRWQPDVIHVWHPPSPRLGQFLKWSGQGSRLVVTAMTPPRKSRHWLSPKANRWFVPTEQLGQAWRAWGISAERIKEIAPCGGEARMALPSRADLLQTWDLPQDARLILCTGPVQNRSGHISALWAADILHYVHQEAFLLILGEGAERHIVREFARNIGADRFTRFLEPHIPLRAVLPHADILWEPTLQDEITDSVILAQQYGIPLLSVAQPSLQPLVRPQAVAWLPPHDPPLWARLSHELLGDQPRRQRMGQAGQRFAQEHFATETCIARHLKQYERLLATPSPIAQHHAA